MSGTIRIKKWDEFQHYKHRNPPWIRFYRSVLDQPWYRGLSDNAWRFLTELWLLASGDGGKVAYDTLMILKASHRTTAEKALLDSALRELASVDAITIAGTDASTDFLAMLANPLADRVTEYRDTERQSTEPKGSDAAASSPEKPQTFHNAAAPALRSAGVSEGDIGDVLRNWWPEARRFVTSDHELVGFVLWAGKEKSRKGLAWNPAAVFNVSNPDGVERLKFQLKRFRGEGQTRRGPGAPLRVSTADFEV